MKALDLTGQRFGRLQAIRREGRLSGSTAWLCECDCGNKKIVRLNKLRSGRAKSCGCLRSDMTRDRSQTHGLSKTPEYGVWYAMVARCTKTDDPSYSRYGGRGIRVYDRWLKFENFYSDMGPRPSPGLTLERIDNDGDYEPLNCEWATRHRQANNTRANVRHLYRGERLTISQLSRRFGLDYMLLWHRINRAGWSVDKSIETRKRK